MKFTRLPLLLAALSATAFPSLAQQGSSHTYTTVDAYGNVKTETVRTPLADERSTAGLITKQGILGANTTSSTVTYGNQYGDLRAGYIPPSYPVNGPIYGVPAYGYGYPYPYPAVNNNNYFIPQQPYNMQLGPNGNAAWISNIPLGGAYNYNYPAGYGYPGGLPYLPTYNGVFNSGYGLGSITTSVKGSNSSISIGKGGITGRYSGRNNTSSTVVLPGHTSYVTNGYRR